MKQIPFHFWLHRKSEPFRCPINVKIFTNVVQNHELKVFPFFILSDETISQQTYKQREFGYGAIKYRSPRISSRIEIIFKKLL